MIFIGALIATLTIAQDQSDRHQLCNASYIPPAHVAMCEHRSETAKDVANGKLGWEKPKAKICVKRNKKGVCKKRK